METEYPVDGRVHIAVSPKHEESFAFYIRIQTTEGYITVVDYAFAGQTWEKDKPVTVWITTAAECR